MTWQPEPDRRKYIRPSVDAVLAWWLSGTEDEEMREWWATQDAVDCALELVHVVFQALEEHGYRVATCSPVQPKEGT